MRKMGVSAAVRTGTVQMESTFAVERALRNVVTVIVGNATKTYADRSSVHAKYFCYFLQVILKYYHTLVHCPIFVIVSQSL
ncbi:hypothetical protein NEOLI_002580 [Neolecta irregularis DAH-3]|uniref:Uncharacterized protein n=1 Tax=Neolecta irregularis (strain DAH-3) TaxID=1198029 RepID=A0A1U7LUG6_NEOID|nr:hypothetical protein NEOLI_002580 [Neolecta irregularis DAH-3]|eukprot:OLL26223.1 hypothetical protein NEOLI_002580 [Neolecta irregularis DAH-3]